MQGNAWHVFLCFQPAMSSPARALFLIVLCISCVLWAQERYGQRFESSLNTHSLVRRFSDVHDQPSLALTTDTEVRSRYHTFHARSIRTVSTPYASSAFPVQPCQKRMRCVHHFSLHKLSRAVLLHSPISANPGLCCSHRLALVSLLHARHHRV